MRVIFIMIGLAGCATPLSKLGLDTGYEGTAGGFIDGEEGGVDGGPGDDCSGGGVLDCNLDCWVADAKAYIGDGTCDTGQRGPDFNCELLDYDSGDCQDSSDVDEGPDPADGGDEDSEGATDGGDESSGADDGGSASAGATDGGSTEGGGTDAGSTGEGVSDGGEADGGATVGGTTDAGGTGDDGSWGGESGGTDDSYDSGLAVGDACIATEEWTMVGISYGLFFDDYVYGATGIGSSGYLDCALTCVPNEVYEGVVISDFFSDTVFPGWLGDGYCDDGISSSADFECVELAWDLGDCPEGYSGSGGTGSGSTGGTGSGSGVGGSTGGGATTMPGSTCTADTPEGPVDGTTDCTGDCFGVSYDVMWYYATDGMCDDGSGSSGTYIDLNCAEFAYDSGDCDESSGAPGVSSSESEY